MKNRKMRSFHVGLGFILGIRPSGHQPFWRFDLMRNRFCWGLASIATLAVSGAWSQGGDSASIWHRADLTVDTNSNPAARWIEKYQTFRVNPDELGSTLVQAPLQGPGQFRQFSIIDLPMPNGTTRKYRICESPIMSDALAQKIPVKTYRVQGIENPAENGRLDFGINGFHGFVRSTDGQSFVIEPVQRGNKAGVFVYFRRDNESPRNFACYTQAFGGGGRTFPGLSARNNGGFQIMAAGDTIKSYRLAMNATGEYTAFHGGETQANAAVVTSVNRQNSVYEIDFAIHLNLIYNKCFTDPNTDPYTNDNGGAMLGENQTETDNSVGDANYDMGHVFSTGGGGVAALNSVGVSGRKAMGVTGLPTPVGDDFDIDFVAHEMGHQFGGRHTFNGTDGNCGGAHDDPAAYEPGSGTTIMAYAGICASEDVQPHSDPYFHVDSLERITAWRNDAQSGGTSTATGNRQPTANAGGDYTIPLQTPFKLTAVGTDADNDPITYCWEQFDLGTATPTTDNTTRPLFRSFNPTTVPSRSLPRMQDIVGGVNSPYEYRPDQPRQMRFRVTVRDNHPGSGGYAFDDMNITVTGAPFSVLEPSTPQTAFGNSTMTVTWNPGGSASANVDIYFSTNRGTDYVAGTATAVKMNTPNDGSETITLPNVNTTQGRLIVQGSGNIFFDINDADITVQQINVDPPVITSISPNSVLAGSGGFTLVVTGNYFDANSKVRWSGADRPTTFVSVNEIRATIGASDVAFAQSIPIRVVTPPPGGGTSNQVTFTINNPVPVVNSVSPTSRTAGGPAFTLIVNGSNFVSNSRVMWNGVGRNTIFVSTSQLKATITAADIASPANNTVTVSTPGPGGGTSAPTNFPVVQNAPQSIAIFPRSITGGQTANGAVYLVGAAGASGMTISLSKVGNPISVPNTATAGAGKFSAPFTVNSVPTANDTVCTVRASANGVTVSNTVTVLAPRPISVTLDPSSINSGQSTSGSFTLNGPAPASGISVTIASGVPGLVQVPATVFVPPGATGGTFLVTTKPYGSQAYIAIWAIYRQRGAYALLNLNP